MTSHPATLLKAGLAEYIAADILDTGLKKTCKCTHFCTPAHPAARYHGSALSLFQGRGLRSVGLNRDRFYFTLQIGVILPLIAAHSRAAIGLARSCQGIHSGLDAVTEAGVDGLSGLSASTVRPKARERIA
jgi:hypothetical protein